MDGSRTDAGAMEGSPGHARVPGLPSGAGGGPRLPDPCPARGQGPRGRVRAHPGCGGFCEGHTRILQRLGAERLGDRRSLARLYGWLIQDLGTGFPAQGACAACEAAKEYERASLTALRDLLHPVTRDPDLHKRFVEGEGLCLSHFVAAASLLEDEESLRVLAETRLPIQP